MKFIVATTYLSLSTCGLGVTAQAPTPCTNWNNGVLVEHCHRRVLRDTLQGLLDQHEDCPNTFAQEVRALTGAQTVVDAMAFVDDMCNKALEQGVRSTRWTDIHPDFNGVFMDEFFDGGTFINEETGNFQNRDESDPRDNFFYPTSESSYQVGQAVEAFANDHATTSFLDAPTDDLRTCQFPAMMCCFGRDRQFGDGNGQCRPRDCDDADPADNTDLLDFPGETEGGVHCHGFAWGEDENDEHYLARYNALYFVSLYDHMYSRGYVESAVPGAKMCGCLEEMLPVSRADCTEVETVQQEVLIKMGAGEVLEAELVSLELGGRPCRGIDAQGNRKNNDLSARLNRMVVEGELSETMRKDMKSVLGK